MKPIIPLCLLALFIPLLSSCQKGSSSQSRQETEQAAEELRNSMKNFVQERADAMDENGAVDTSAEQLDEVIESFEQAGKKLTGDEARVAKAVQAYMKSVQQDIRQWNDHLVLLTEATTYSSIKTKADVDKLSEKVIAYEKVNQMLLSQTNGGWMNMLEKQLTIHGVGSKAKREAMAGARRNHNKLKPFMLEIRHSDADLCKVLLAQHTVLKNSIGHWQWDEAEGAPQFERDEDIDNYNVTADQINAIIEIQTKAEKNLLKTQQELLR